MYSYARDNCFTLLRAFGFSFFFFSKEHEPIHVHVMGRDGYAKYVWNGSEFEFYEQRNVKAKDLKKIKDIIDENSDLIVKYWKMYFKQD
ncbi:MAG: DUF4160 domain-containing protein [Rikenellaceae bacterium]